MAVSVVSLQRLASSEQTSEARLHGPFLGPSGTSGCSEESASRGCFSPLTIVPDPEAPSVSWSLAEHKVFIPSFVAGKDSF